MERDERIAHEALALRWALFAEPPIVAANGWEIIAAVVWTAPVRLYDFNADPRP